ncbi:hypothetical protein [Shewanella sp. GXUN23E]|uniref:hypothetical protein n=1 Tax=Shewanella sp. GXUN23E TaxID=3422498 RepID=UPI003D7CCDF6
MSKFNEFFEKLASDAALMEAYKLDPQGVMAAEGLSEDEIAAVMSGDEAKIKELSGSTDTYAVFIHIQSPSK